MGYLDLSSKTGPSRRFRAVVDGLPIMVVPENSQRRMRLGKIKRVTMHWSACDYQTTFDAYHYCIVYDKKADKAHVVRMLKLNQMGQHAAKANTGNVGVSFMAMKGADTTQFGSFPVTNTMLKVGARFVAEFCFRYKLDPEKAVTDHEHVDREVGNPPGRRWDIRPYLAEFKKLVIEQHSRLIRGDKYQYGGILDGGQSA